MVELLSYHGDPKVKAKYLRRIRQHERADEIVKGQYWESGKGCCVGCLVHCDDAHRVHSIFPTLAGPGWPKWLAMLADTIFEGLPNSQAKRFPAKLTAAIPVGVDLEPVKYRFAVMLMDENAKRVKRLKIRDELKQQVLAAIERVRTLNLSAAETGQFDKSVACSAALSASAAASSSAASASASARSAASAASASAWWSAWSASASAWWSAWSASRSAAAYIRYADALIELMRSLS